VAIKFTGEFTSPRSPDDVFDFLADPNKFGPLLPDFESMTVQDATHFTVKVRVGVGNIRGTAEIKMELAEALRPQRALYKGRGTAVGSQITISAGFDLSPMPESTRVAWQGEANVFGKLASMAGGMLEPLGKKNIQKLIDGLQWALTMPAAKVVGEEPPPVVELPLPVVETPIPAVEAPGFIPANSDIPQSGALAPAEALPAADSAAQDLDSSSVTGSGDKKP
jgi:carbon monoxide dehydrogenase subunit G